LSDSLRDMVYDELINVLHDQKRFNVLLRKQFDDILAVHKISKSSLLERDTVERMSKIKPAQTILIGSCYEVGNSVEIFARLVDTETTRVIASKNVYSDTKNLSDLKNALFGLGVKLKNYFPVTKGMIVKKSETTVSIEAEEKEKVRMDWRYLVYRRVNTRTDTNILGGEPVVLGEVKNVDIGREFPLAEILVEKQKIHVNDSVISR